MDDTVTKHGEEVTRASEHECKGVISGRLFSECLIGIAEEMHGGGAQEDAARELGAQDKQAIVPFHEARRDARKECREEHDD